ncbi:MAG: hypothetical protein RI897_2343 [Verrucomicrobiota bacterium]
MPDEVADGGVLVGLMQGDGGLLEAGDIRGVDRDAGVLDLLEGFGGLGFPELALEAGGVIGGGLEDLLVFGGELVPDVGVDEEDIGDAGMLIKRVVWADLVVAGSEEAGRVIFSAIDDALVEGGIEFAEGDGCGGAAHGFDHINGGAAVLDPDFQSLQVGGGEDGFGFAIEAAAAGVVVAEAAEELIGGGEKEVLSDGSFDDLPEVLFAGEDVRDGEDAHDGGETLEGGGGGLHHVDCAELGEFDHFAFRTELAIGEDLDLELAPGALVDFLRERFHGEVDRVLCIERVPEAQRGGAHAVA